MTVGEFNRFLEEPEIAKLEFKTAKSEFRFEELLENCVGIENEGGELLIFGVTDDLPHRVIGSQAFPNKEASRVTL